MISRSFHRIFKSQQMALFSFPMSQQDHINSPHFSCGTSAAAASSMKSVVTTGLCRLPLCSLTLRDVSWQQTLSHAGECRSHQLYTCVTGWTRRRVTSWSDICCHSHDIYHIIQAQKSINIREKNWWKLFYIRSVAYFLFWLQEHLVLASSALLVLTSNGLLRALQGDYLCTISESLWSLCDNGILS